MSEHLVLIGGFGFVGRNILEQLAVESSLGNLTPVVVDDLSNACPGHEALTLKKFIGPYQSEACLEFLDKLEGRRTLVFLAGETRVAESRERPLDFIAANISEPSSFIWRAIRPGDHFILISTAGALFDGSSEITTATPYCPKNFYGATKAAEEMILEKMVALRGGSFWTIRMTNVYGRFSDLKKSAIHAFTRAAIKGEIVTLNGDGKQTRDFIYAGDVGRGIIKLAAKAIAGESTQKINILGAASSISLMDVVSAVESAAGKPLRYEQIEAKELIATEPRDVIVSPDAIRGLLNDFVTPFQDGVRRTYEYYAAAPN